MHACKRKFDEADLFEEGWKKDNFQLFTRWFWIAIVNGGNHIPIIIIEYLLHMWRTVLPAEALYLLSAHPEQKKSDLNRFHLYD